MLNLTYNPGYVIKTMSSILGTGLDPSFVGPEVCAIWRESSLNLKRKETGLLPDCGEISSFCKIFWSLSESISISFPGPWKDPGKCGCWSVSLTGFGINPALQGRVLSRERCGQETSDMSVPLFTVNPTCHSPGTFQDANDLNFSFNLNYRNNHITRRQKTCREPLCRILIQEIPKCHVLLLC